MNGKHSLPTGGVQTPSASVIDRWAEWLRILFPLGTLLNRTAQRDPVHGIALPDAEMEEDTAMISAYYLSFYE